MRPIEQVDKVLFDFGFPMGAFQMGDLAGLDLGWDKDNSNPMDVKDRLCELGRRGQKTGAGSMITMKSACQHQRL